MRTLGQGTGIGIGFFSAWETVPGSTTGLSFTQAKGLQLTTMQWDAPNQPFADTGNRVLGYDG